MTEFQISTIINKPVDIICKALNNPDNHTYWTTDLERFEVIKGGPDMVGSVARLHYSQKGKTYIMEDKLIYCEPGKKYISEVSGDAINATVETNLKAIGDKTEMSLKWSGRGKVFFLKLLLPIFRGRMIKQAKFELGTFKKLVEERGSIFKQ